MIEAKPENHIGDRAYDSDPLDHALRQNGIAACDASCGAGWSNASSPGSNGSAGDPSSDGNIIQRTSLASFN
jgi:hypothetical protein